MRRHPWALVLAAFSLLPMPAGAQSLPAAKKAGPGEIEHLIKQLGSSSFPEREAASKRLEAIGVPALDALRRAVSSGPDLETRRRAERLISRIENGLDGLLAAYRSYELPLPPPQARLVRVPDDRGLAFEVVPATENAGPCFLEGTFQWRPPRRVKTREAAPGPEELEDMATLDPLAWALQCHARGWDRLASALLQRSRKKARVPLQRQIQEMAWEYWYGQITEVGIDRVPVARHLKELMQQDSSWDSAENRAVLRSLELALVPSKAKAGSIEALIDDLVDHTRDTEVLGTFEPGDRYGRIARLGFDAVPALIEHLDDDRLTRAVQLEWRTCWHLRVGDLAAGLLEGLAGDDEETGSFWLFRKDRGARKAAARKWWEEAQRMGEEAYLLDNVLPYSPRRISLHRTVLEVIIAKYPRRLPPLYREVLEQHAELDSELLADAVLRCRLPDREKLALLVSAARHKENRHRLPALRALLKLDRGQFNKLLLVAIESLPRDVDGTYRECPEAALAELVNEADDPAVWQALETAARRATVGLRMEMLARLCEEESRHPSRRLSLLSRFLEDATVRNTEASDTADKLKGSTAAFHYPQIEVRNFAALEMAKLLGIKAPLNRGRTAEAWAQLRGEVRAAYQRKRDG